MFTICVWRFTSRWCVMWDNIYPFNKCRLAFSLILVKKKNGFVIYTFHYVFCLIIWVSLKWLILINYRWMKYTNYGQNSFLEVYRNLIDKFIRNFIIEYSIKKKKLYIDCGRNDIPHWYFYKWLWIFFCEKKTFLACVWIWEFKIGI